MNELQDVIDEGSVSSTAVEVLKMFDQDRKYSAWIGGSTLSSRSTFQQLWTTKHHGVRCNKHPQVFVRRGRIVRQRGHASGDRRADAE